METMPLENTMIETAVTLPSKLFQRAEDLAQHWGISRDEFFTRATQELLEKHQPASEPSPEIIRQWQEFYAQEDSSLDPVLMQMQMTALDEEKW